MWEEIEKQAQSAVTELLQSARLHTGDLLVVGCSSSEIMGTHIGKGSSLQAAQAVYDGIVPVLREQGIELAAQCCEHLNRALVVERECMQKYDFTQVSVRPVLHAGGAWSVQAVEQFSDPVVVEDIGARARAGIDIGGVFIGMHMRPVCVPVHNENTAIGCANITMARTRPKLIGGERAQY